VPSKDPRAIIDDGIMSLAQWLAVLVTIGLNALDGFDVLSISERQRSGPRALHAAHPPRAIIEMRALALWFG
jgi:hypothetical protein